MFMKILSSNRIIAAELAALAPRYMGGAPEKIVDADLIPCNLNADGFTDFVVFKP
jgi:hypothetical protein